MSVLIKGAEMPKSCWVCELGGAEQMDNHTCPFYAMEYREQEEYQDKIADGCPLVPVPPHGRLIDADAMCERMERLLRHCKPNGHAATRIREMMVELVTAPTGIEAGEVDDGKS